MRDWFVGTICLQTSRTPTEYIRILSTSHDHHNKKPNSSLLKLFLKYNIYIITLEGET